MYSNLPNLIIGFHGCDLTTYENVLYKHERLRASHNSYDWLGNGIYFWENSLDRAGEWQYLIAIGIIREIWMRSLKNLR